MTSRLKRKLNDLGIDTTSSRSNENYCLIGTPLPPLEKSKDTGEFVPLWKQEVRDEKGRRRLHGAFTGGFSAGYFNSVGSKEGWAPSTFTSSRSDRAKAKLARPEDFMDEEDLAELRDNQKLVDTSEAMDVDFWGRKGPSSQGNDDSLVGALQNALLPEPVDSAGGRILKKMGWRIGHGIGPKLTYEQHRREMMLAHSTLDPEMKIDEPEDHDEAKRHLYPRRDTKVLVMPKKDDKHGVGYDPGASLAVLNNQKEDEMSQGPNISAGFGLGALNDADEDDLDIYESGSHRRTNRRMAYDDEEEENQDHIRIGKQNQRSLQEDRQPQPRTHAFKSGVPCLPGFVIAKEIVVERNLFPPPKLPEDWSPDPRRVWSADKETLNEVSQPMEDINNLPSNQRRSAMTIEQRGEILGEEKLPKEKRSVFDYLSSKDKERLRNLATSQKASIPAVKDEPGPTEDEIRPTVPRLDVQVAKMALHGFQPFTTDPVKQSRYTAYLKAQAEGSDTVPFQQLPNQNTDSFKRELEDYARSAQIFKPVSGAMAGRFTRAAVIETATNANEGLHKPESEGSYMHKPSNEEKEPLKEESPKENAARLGMYGALTREVTPWVPAKLLCKRFGVKEPQVEVPVEVDSRNGASTSQWQTGGILAITDGVDNSLGGTTKISDDKNDETASKPPGPKQRDLSNIGYGDEDEMQGQGTLTYQKPSMDIFKAIFASDEEDEEGDNDNNKIDSDSESNTAQPSGQAPTTKTSLVDDPTASLPPEVRGDTSTSIPSTIMVESEVINVDTFKPKFVPRTTRTEAKTDGKNDKGRSREKKKKKVKTLVSFDLDEGGVAGEVGRDEEDGKKRKKKKEARMKGSGLDDDGMWVEKEAPAIVHNFAPVVSQTQKDENGGELSEKEMGPQRGRKRAIDFM